MIRTRVPTGMILGFVSKADFSRRPVSPRPVFFESRRDSTTVLRQSLVPAGMTLMELLAALIIAATVAAVSIQYLRPPSETGKQRSCDLTRAMLQNDAQRYFDTTGVMPRTDLRELATAEYAGVVVPTCPVTGEAYRLDRNGIVGCPTHEATRVK